MSGPTEDVLISRKSAPSKEILYVPKGSVPIENIVNLIGLDPQRDANGGINYLVTGGIAIELITGKKREHNDIDTVDLRCKPYRLAIERDLLGFEGIVYLDQDLLKQTAYTVNTNLGGKDLAVLTVHPVILLLHELSFDDRVEKHTKDLDSLIAFYKNQQQTGVSWNLVIKQVLEKLPVFERDKIQAKLDKLS